MFIQYTQTKKGGKVKYAKIVESYKINKKCKHRQILNLGPVKTKEDVKKYNAILESMRAGSEFVNIKDMKLENCKEYGVTYALQEILSKYGLDNVLKYYLNKNRCKFSVYKIVEALISNRLSNPSSDLSAITWIRKRYPIELNVKIENVYRALDYLIEQKENIEANIFKTLKSKLKLDTSKAHYDLTSSYFEGEKCEIALFGYSRDHRPDRKQIVIGLVMVDGIPSMHQVYEGNTVDKSTLKEMQGNARQKLNIRKPIIVADGGLLTKNNRRSLEEAEDRYLLACPRRNNKNAEKYLTLKFNTNKHQDAVEAHKECYQIKNKEHYRRYIVCVDNKTKKERIKKLEHIKEQIETKLKELQIQYEKSKTRKKGKKPTRDSVMLKANNILGRNKRLFNIKGENSLTFKLNKEKYKYEKTIAGRFLLVTNTDLKPKEAMKTYKELQTVENAFDELKNFLDIRPIYHWKPRRVKAHVFICVLAFLIECIIERFSSHTARKIIQELRTIQVAALKSKTRDIKMITKLASKSESIFKNLNLPPPRVYVPG